MHVRFQNDMIISLCRRIYRLPIIYFVMILHITLQIYLLNSLDTCKKYSKKKKKSHGNLMSLKHYPQERKEKKKKALDMANLQNIYSMPLAYQILMYNLQSATPKGRSKISHSISFNFFSSNYCVL